MCIRDRYTGGMAYWYGGNLSLLYSFQINRLRSVVLLLGMYFFYLYAIEGVHYILRQKNENVGTATEKTGKWGTAYQKYSFWMTWGIDVYKRQISCFFCADVWPAVLCMESGYIFSNGICGEAAEK